METINKSPFNTALKYGVILGLISIVMSVLFYILGMSTSKIPQYLGWIFIIGVIIFGTREHRDKDLGGFMSYGRGVGTGVLIVFFGALIAAVYTFVFVKYIDPSFIGQILQGQEQEMIDKGMGDEEIEMAMKYTKMMMTPAWMTFWVVAAEVFIGLIISLIAAAFLKKDETR